MTFKELIDDFFEKLKESFLKGEEKEIEDILKEILQEKAKEVLEEELKATFERITRKTEKTVLKKIKEKMGNDISKNALKAYILKSLRLSSRIHNNVKSVQKSALKIINEAEKNRQTFEWIRKKLYEGYRFGENDVLDLKTKLPSYLNKDKEIAKIQALSLKTKPLKAAYLAYLESKNAKELEKNLKVAIEEKSRFFAKRIAETEEARAFALSRAMDILENDSIEFAKYNKCSCHKIIDQCDFFASVDFGYGKGIYPKEEMITLPLHPFCKCYYSKIHRKIKKKKDIKEPYRTTALNMQNREKIFDKWGLDYIEEGKHPIDILNEKIFEWGYRINVFPAFIKQIEKDTADKFKKVQEQYEDMVKNKGYRPLSRTEKIAPPLDEFDEFGNEYNEPTEEEKEAIAAYTDYDFGDMRDFNEGKNSDEKIRKKVEILEGIFASYAPNSKNKILYRGTRLERNNYNRFAKLKIGEPFVPDYSFSSWSEKESVARDFAEPDIFKTPIILRLIDSGIGGYKISKYAVEWHQEEEEVLLPRYSVFEVVDKWIDDEGILRIDLIRRDDLEGKLKGWNTK